jgi:hypothetical protein
VDACRGRMATKIQPINHTALGIIRLLVMSKLMSLKRGDKKKNGKRRRIHIRCACKRLSLRHCSSLTFSVTNNLDQTHIEAGEFQLRKRESANYRNRVPPSTRDTNSKSVPSSASKLLRLVRAIHHITFHTTISSGSPRPILNFAIFVEYLTNWRTST